MRGGDGHVHMWSLRVVTSVAASRLPEAKMYSQKKKATQCRGIEAIACDILVILRNKLLPWFPSFLSFFVCVFMVVLF